MATPRAPAKRQCRTAQGRRSLSGARSKHCFCTSRIRGSRFADFWEAET